MLKIPQSHYDALRKHGEDAYPHESCGVLLGQFKDGTRIVREVIRCGNGDTETPERRYNIPPEELIAAQKMARAKDLDIVGFYHSHPDHPPQWSHHDLEEAHWFACSYVITGVQKGSADATKSFVLCGNDEETKRFDDEGIEIDVGTAA
jgi:proteasome lid subunit RPN8/RPN11